MDKIIERIKNTKANTIERAHEVENFIDTELYFCDSEYSDMVHEDLTKLKSYLKSEHCEKEIADLVYEIDNEIQAMAMKRGVK